MTTTCICPRCGWSLALEPEDQELLRAGGRVIADCGICGEPVICEPSQVWNFYGADEAKRPEAKRRTR